MLTDQLDWHIKNGYSSRSNLQIQSNAPSKCQHNSSRTWMDDFRLHNKTQRNQNLKIIINNKRTARGVIIPDLKLYYSAIVIKNDMVLTWNQTHWSMESNWRPRHKSTYQYKTDCFLKKPEVYTRKNTASSTNGTHQTVYQHVEESKWVLIYHHA